MTRLDSVKIIVPNNCLELTSDSYHTTLKNRNELITEDSFTFNKLGVRGLKSIKIDNMAKNTILDFSSKILRADYVEGINKNTISQAIDNINDLGLIKLDTNKFIDSAKFLSLDVTDNIKLGYETNELFYTTLANVPLAQKYDISYYRSKSNLGVVWSGKQKTLKDRFIFYDKTKEIKKDKTLFSTDYANKITNDFIGVNRIEQNLTSLAQIRAYYKTTNLTDVLNSDTKANLIKFTKMTSKSDNNFDLRLFEHYQGMSYKAIRISIGEVEIIKRCNYDWSRIELFVKSFCDKNYRRYLVSMRDEYQRLNKALGKTDIGIIEQIKQLLSA